MVEEQEAEFTSLHRNIENTSTSGMIYTEQLLSIRRRPQKPERKESLHVTRQNKRKKKKKELGQGLHTGEGPVKEESFLHLQKALH